MANDYISDLVNRANAKIALLKAAANADTQALVDQINQLESEISKLKEVQPGPDLGASSSSSSSAVGVLSQWVS